MENARDCVKKMLRNREAAGRTSQSRSLLSATVEDEKKRRADFPQQVPTAVRFHAHRVLWYNLIDT